ncbi:D-alanine--D-alanine ligase [Polaromonas sp. JS666]|uniref:D-alanine--D-alanine ligase n=1 Tax=Polaromonas sp. (strain JS666 / ATCC BAA-500) TaxID=296591 RepID=DDL_POLSJ|nr:D-alanine--D-alanine ligase [Polaromonas sp. JS666]Q12EL3.1 RecName: Full=D-alanine--D-alanine ligase; AltName: Full=D-Ala-D-Ala ligase; AltName: Full=D-alanylalanine synthetase [Polaromonas sp. JS666]ABE43029.1 D-alanine--D-alanine ligase [Polaromonas sp. JS666]
MSSNADTSQAVSAGTSVGATFGKVAVLMGGMSAEREISLMSGRGVLQALRSRGVDAHAFDPAERDISELKKDEFARCFIALHGRFGEDGTVQGALELLGIPYTGSGVMASSMAIDKVMTKRVMLAEGLPTPTYVLLRRGSYGSADVSAVPDKLGLPLIVKPAREGSSIGLTKVTERAGMADAVAQAEKLDADILCEQFISGDEVTCPVLGTGSEARALPVIRIVAPDGNYDYQNKYFTDTTQYLVPCGLPEGEEAVIQQLVLQAYRTLNCRGWARADVMIDKVTRKPYLLEINTSPGMTGHSLVPMSARAAGISYEDLCIEVLKTTALDHQSQGGGAS